MLALADFGALANSFLKTCGTKGKPLLKGIIPWRWVDSRGWQFLPVLGMSEVKNLIRSQTSLVVTKETDTWAMKCDTTGWLATGLRKTGKPGYNGCYELPPFFDPTNWILIASWGSKEGTPPRKPSLRCTYSLRFHLQRHQILDTHCQHLRFQHQYQHLSRQDRPHPAISHSATWSTTIVSLFFYCFLTLVGWGSLYLDI